MRVRPEISERFSRPDFGQIWVRRLSDTASVVEDYVEDSVIEPRSKMAGRWDVKTCSYFWTGPKVGRFRP